MSVLIESDYANVYALCYFVYTFRADYVPPMLRHRKQEVVSEQDFQLKMPRKRPRGKILSLRKPHTSATRSSPGLDCLSSPAHSLRSFNHFPPGSHGFSAHCPSSSNHSPLGSPNHYPGSPDAGSHDHNPHGSHDHNPHSSHDHNPHGSHDHNPPGSHHHNPPGSPDHNPPGSPDHNPPGSHDHNPPGSHHHNPHGSHDHNPHSSHDHNPPGSPDHNPPGSHDHNPPGSHDHNPPGSHDHNPPGSHDHNPHDSHDHNSPGSHDHNPHGSHDHNPPGSHDHNPPGSPPGSHDHNPPGSHDHNPPGSPPGSHDHNPPGSHDHNPPGSHDHNPPGSHDHNPHGSHDRNPPGSHDSNSPGSHDHNPPGSHDHNTCSPTHSHPSSDHNPGSPNYSLSGSPNQNPLGCPDSSSQHHSPTASSSADKRKWEPCLWEYLDADIQSVLPPSKKYTYVLEEVNVKQKAEFEGAPSHSFHSVIRMNVSSEAEAREWLEEMMAHTLTTYRITRTFKPGLKRVKCKLEMHCQHHKKALTPVQKKQSALAKSKKSRYPLTHTNRDKKTKCPAKLKLVVQIPTKKQHNMAEKRPYLLTHTGVLSITHCHNHPLTSAHVLSFRDVCSETKEVFQELFSMGHSAATARHTHEQQQL